MGCASVKISQYSCGSVYEAEMKSLAILIFSVLFKEGVLGKFVLFVVLFILIRMKGLYGYMATQSSD